MLKSRDLWHFARPALARQYLREFAVGLVAARALFARRRMGKSEFLEMDLMPEARRQGYLTAYLNLWQARSSPTQALAAALGSALRPKGLKKLLKLLKSVKSVKASAGFKGITEGRIEAEWAGLDRKQAAPLLVSILEELPQDSPTLLILDEAQVLAQKEHHELAFALRANLDSRKNSIKVVFAGSSEATLRQMFGRAREPFYNWAPLVPFPLLGEDFVLALTEIVNGLSRYPLKAKEALEAFERLQRTPEFFRRYLNRYLAYASEGSRAALDDTLAHVYHAEEYAQQWQLLAPLDREMLLLLAGGTADLFSETARRALARSLAERQPVSNSAVQKALGRLQSLDVLVRIERGHYDFQDEVFGEWIRRRTEN
ncbi:MAG: hypothetical protein WB646_17090 [Steroidobacteraceae bacterium]